MSTLSKRHENACLVTISYEDLKSRLQSGDLSHEVVLFTRYIEDQESYFDDGMLARIGRLVKCHDAGSDTEFLEVEMCIGEFEAHKDSVEKRTYWDEHHNPTLGAKESGFYPKAGIDTVNIDKASFDDTPYFFLVEGGATGMGVERLRPALVTLLLSYPAQLLSDSQTECLDQWARMAESDHSLDKEIELILRQIAAELFVRADLQSSLSLLLGDFLRALIKRKDLGSL